MGTEKRAVRCARQRVNHRGTATLIDGCFVIRRIREKDRERERVQKTEGVREEVTRGSKRQSRRRGEGHERGREKETR